MIILTILLAVIMYFGAMYYLDKRYQLQPYNSKIIWSLSRKRNWVFAGIYLAAAFFAGWLFPAYGYGYLDIVRRLLLLMLVWIVAYIDMRETIIPNVFAILILWLGGIFLIIRIVQQPQDALPYIGTALTGMVFAGGIFLVSRLFSKQGIGMGDVKLFGVMGFYLGTYTIIGVMMISLFTVSAAGLVNIARKKVTIKQEIPFAPYIAVGTTLALLLGF